MPNPTSPTGTVRPAIMRILAVDLAAFFFSILPLMAVAVYLFFRLAGGQPLRYLLFQVGLGGMVVIGLAGAAWRVLLFRRVFAAGLAVRAVINNITITREQCQLQLGYTYAGRAYTTTSRVLDNNTTHVMRPGESVTVMVDPIKPTRAFIQKLFI